MDEWPVLAVNSSIPQHKTARDRHIAACSFLNEVGDQFPVNDELSAVAGRFDVVLDNEFNEFNRALSSWPTRYWIVDADLRVQLKCMPEGEFVSLAPLEQWLKENVSRGV